MAQSFLIVLAIVEAALAAFNLSVGNYGVAAFATLGTFVILAMFMDTDK